MTMPSAIGRVREPRSPQAPNSGAATMYTSMKAGISQPSWVSESAIGALEVRAERAMT